MEIEYRIANRIHFVELAKLRYEFKENNYEYDKAFIEKYVEYLNQESKNNRIQVFCAFVNGRIIGNFNLILIPKSPTPGKEHNCIAYLTNANIKSEFRNLNIGTELLKMITHYAEQENIELVFVWPSEKSVPFYERNGFTGDNEILEKVIVK